MKHIIRTGASRGLGKAVADSFCYENFVLHLISRSDMGTLKKEMSRTAGSVFTYRADLSNAKSAEDAMEEVFDNVKDPEFLALVNNAAVLDPIGPLGMLNNLKLTDLINTNLTAPIILMNEFIREASDFDTEKRVVNISSGAARKPYYGWSAYCASKAGLDLASQVAAREQEEIKGDRGVKVVSLSPGIVNTDMQALIRKQPRVHFLYVGKFSEYFKSGALKEPEEIAEKIKELLFLDFFPNGEVLDIRDF